MSKLNIQGIGSKEYDYDTTEITLSFRYRGKNSAESVKHVKEQCEEFLVLIKETGIDIESIRISDDSISQNYYSQNFEVIATRSLQFIIPFDMEFANYIRELVVDKKYDVEISTENKLSNIEEVRKELLKLAIEDSKEKAGYVAELMGQKIVGIESIETSEQQREKNKMWLQCEQERGIAVKRDSVLSDSLKAPSTVEKETVDIVWILE